MKREKSANRSTKTSGWLFALAVLAATTGVRAFNIPVHTGITRATLVLVSLETSSGTIRFSQRAVEEIVRANVEMDSVALRSAAYYRPERHFLNDTFLETSKRLVQLRSEIKTGLLTNSMSGADARKRLGWALHAIQDFYSHSTWLELGRTTILNDLGAITYRNPYLSEQPCKVNAESVEPLPSPLGSAYYKGEMGCNASLLPEGKCFHGNYSFLCVGINKDLDENAANFYRVPMHPRHHEARSLALAASRKFVADVLSDLDESETAVRRLLNDSSGLGFIIDDSGSMGDTIIGVYGTVARMTMNASPVEQIVFLRFGDPFVGSPLIVSSVPDLLSAVKSIVPEGGGDCAELSQSALLAGIGAAPEGSQIFLFTDATAKDSHLGGLVSAKAQERLITLNYGLTGSCSPIDPAYIRGAHETGGLVIRAQPSELPRLAPLIQSIADGDLETILRRRLMLVEGAVVEVPIPVDGSIQELTLLTSIEANDAQGNYGVELQDPDGAVILPANHLVELEGMRILRVANPKVGLWRARLSGAGPVSLQARGKSSIGFTSLQVVEPNLDIHGGFERVGRTTSVGEEVILEASVGTEIRQPGFMLVDESGETFNSLLMGRDMPNGDAEFYYATLAMPDRAFRMRVQGIGTDGSPIMRESASLVRPQRLAVGSSDAFIELEPGVRKLAEIRFKNSGPQATYSVNVSDPAGYALSVSPTVLMLPPGTEGVVQVAYQASAGAAEGDSSRATIRFTNHDVSTAYSQINQNLFVVSGQPAACLSPKSQASLWPPNGKMREGRVGDYLNSIGIDVGQQQAYKVLRVTQDELRTNPAGPDATGVGTPVLGLRVERRGDGNGRVYRVEYEAQGEGGKCVGWFNVGVPHSASTPAVDDGQIHVSAP